MDSRTIEYFDLGKKKYFRYDRKGASEEFHKALELEPDNFHIKGWLAISLAILEKFDEAIAILKTFRIKSDVFFIAGGIILEEMKEDDAAAIKSFTRAIKINPNNELAYTLRACCYSEVGKNKEALVDIEVAKKLNPNAYVHINYGIIKNKANDRDGAFSNFSNAIELDSKNPRGWYWRGREHRIKKHYELALIDFNKAIEFEPDNKYAWQNRSQVRKEMNDFVGALEDINTALAIDPNEAWALVHRAILKHTYQKDHNGAFADYDKAIELDPEIKSVWTNRALLYIEMKDYNGALGDFNKAIDINPNLVWAIENRGRLKHEELNDHDGALADFNKAIELNTDNAWTWLDRGNVYRKLREDDRAILDYSEAIERDPKNKWGWFYRACLQREKGKYKEALADFDKAISIDSGFASALSDRGYLKLRMGDKSGAMQDYNNAILSDPGNATPWANRGSLKNIDGDKQGAINDLCKALEIRNNYGWALSVRADVYNSLGEFELCLSDKSKYYAIEGIPESTYNTPMDEDVCGMVYSHLVKEISPILADRGEKLIEYWECFLHWGKELYQVLNSGNQTFTHTGKYGMGFIVLSDQYLRIISLGNLSKKYAKQMGLGLAKKFFLALLSNFDMRSIEKNNKHWTISFKDINGLQNEDEGIILTTPSEAWQFFSYFSDDDDCLQAALELARTGKLMRLIDVEKIRTNSKKPSSDDDIIQQIERLATLREKGIVTQDEFEQKKKELLARL